MFMFGDVISSPAECLKLGTLIQKGLDSELATESCRGYLSEIPGQLPTACVQTLALIGHCGNLDEVRLDLDHYGKDKTRTISRFTRVGEELLKHTVRWQLVENLSAQEIIDRLLAERQKTEQT